MLIIEHHSNGTRTVKIKKDWHPNRIGRAHVPNKNYVGGPFMERVQRALLDKKTQWK